MKTSEKQPAATPKTANEKKVTSANKELKTDFPMSEKDEVKQAERNTQKQVNKGR